MILHDCWRAGDQSSVAAAISDTVKLREEFSNELVGFDLVTQEDTGHSLLYFIDQLLYPLQQGIDLPYFFHAGETGA